MRGLLTLLALATFVATPAFAQEGQTPPAEKKADDTDEPEVEPLDEAADPPAEKKADPPAAKKADPPAEKKADPPKKETPPALDAFDKDDDDDADEDEEDEGEDDGWGEEEPEPTFPRMEHRGYFRFRADMMGNMHLGTAFYSDAKKRTVGTSPWLPPLTENDVNNNSPGVPGEVGKSNEEAFLASANMRFRYQPTFLISESWKFTATFDIMDNLVLGSTPDYNFERADSPFNAFAQTQAPPGQNFQFQDSIRVKELYGEWRILGIPLRFGRMASDWGLGILANDGNGWDDDFGDYQDRIMGAIQLYGIYIAGGYDIVSSGPTYKQDLQPFGQAYDVTETDDVQQGFLAIFQRPLQPEEVIARRKRLVQERKPVVDWGVYAVYRSQKLDLSQSSLNDDLATFDDTELVVREAWAVIPDAWIRFEWRPSYTTKWTWELEFAMIIGEIAQTQDFDGAGKSKKKILSFGYAFETEYTTGGLSFGLRQGLASGDDAKCLGVLDCKNFAFAASDSNNDNGANSDLTNFKFDRNYTIDMIMFREIVGAISNAHYYQPFIRYDLFDSPDGAIGGQLDVLVAGAMEKSAYPGESAYLGTELDAKIFVEDSNKFYADVSFGLFFPGPAFDFLAKNDPGLDEDKKASIAWTLQTHIVLKY